MPRDSILECGCPSAAFDELLPRATLLFARCRSQSCATPLFDLTIRPYSMKRVCTIVCFIVLASEARALAEWSQYRGPAGNGICNESPNLKWPAGGPKLLWKEPVKKGFSSFTIAYDKAFTQMNRDIER